MDLFTTIILFDRDETALRAYLAWQADGRPHGRDIDYWLAAERQVQNLRAVGSIAAETPRSPSKQAKSNAKPPQTAGLGLKILGAI